MSADGGNTAYRVTLPDFEGPLDLLLHLCKTHELDIVNIPIAFITRKYLEYLEVMQSMSVDVAADYLVMAATLAYLKSRELVPTPEPLDTSGEESESDLDPREELIRRLLEYQKYKHAAEQLGGRPIEGRTVFPRGVPIEKDDPSGRPFGDHSVWKLIEAFGKILEKTGKASTHDVVVDRISIGERIGQLVDRMRSGGGSFRFDACFDMTLPEVELRHQVVVTLLAILELARLKAVRVLQSPTDDTLFITQVSDAALESARNATITSVIGESEADGEEKHEEAYKDEPAAPIVEEVTNPDINRTDFDETEDTAVNAAPAELLQEAARPDDWDGPTHEATAAELAVLAASSTETSGEFDPEAELAASSTPGHIESVIESLLFASDRPLPVSDLKRLVGERAGSTKVVAALEALRARRDQEGSGIQVVEVAGGWHLRTRSENVGWVSRLIAGKPQRLTRAMLETLSIVAYRQPITRPEIDDVRGVDCGPVLKTLLDRGLVRMIGKKEEVGRPILYGTTPEFLRIFSLRALAELPTLREFHELGAAEMAKVDAEAPPSADATVKVDADKPAAPPARRELDPEEDDELSTELERAAAAAVKAAAATEAPTVPGSPPPQEGPTPPNTE